MKDSLDLSAISPGLPDSSSTKHFCTNEIIIRNQPYIISMMVHHSKQILMDLEVEAKESADQWKATFDVAGNQSLNRFYLQIFKMMKSCVFFFFFF